MTSPDKLLALAKQKYAWPGGYPLLFLMKDGGVLCPDCVVREWETISQAEDDPQWELEGYFIHYEGPPWPCDHCYEFVESAYGEAE